MVVLSIIMMGGTMLFPDDRVHQILGIALLVLWICHTVFHRRWYASLFRGKYTPFRIIQLVVNIGISMCALLLMTSGLMMAWFMPVSVGLDFARTAHLVSSHWYYILMSVHLGMHLSQIFARLKIADSWAFRVCMWGVCAYGLYAFIVRGVWKYMFLLQPFFFLDLDHGYILFAVDYIAILVMFATGAYYIKKGFADA